MNKEHYQKIVDKRYARAKARSKEDPIEATWFYIFLVPSGGGQVNLEISLSESQLAGRLPVYIKGKRYWLVGEKTRQQLIDLRKLQAENLELLEQAKIFALKKKDK